MLTVRAATGADLPALLALEQAFPGDRLTRSNFRYLLGRSSSEVWVYVGANALLGDAIVLFKKRSRRARLYSLIVAPFARGRGIARALVRTVETAAAARGCNCVSLEVRTDNAAALALYAKLGYGIVGKIPRYYDDGCHALQLERALGATAGPTDLAA